MTTKTRYFLLGSIAILVLGLCTGLVAYYGGLPMSGFARSAGPAELGYVPSNAAIVAYANVHDVMASDLRQRLKAVIPHGEEHGREEFRERTGIDIERDIDYIVACMTRADTSNPGHSTGFVAFRGRFDTVRLEALARQHGATVAEYRGKRLIELRGMRDPDDDDEGEPGGETRHEGPKKDAVLAFVEPGLVMFGDGASIRQALDVQAGAGPNVTANAEMMQLVRDIESGANAWAVGRFDILSQQARIPQNISAQIPAVKWFAASGRVNGGISGELRAEARDDQSAQNLRDVVQGFVALARMQAGSKPELQSMLQALQLGGTGRTVSLSFAVPSEVIDRMVPKPEGEAN